MQQSYDVAFVTSNVNKYEEVEKILAEFGIKSQFFPNRISRNSRRFVIQNSPTKGRECI